ncbi:fatty acid desaturase family protein [Spelaeicoccus albus]|uniref:Fatty acid desaturase n=1 Tax=Spelaeicoccus albus TaxID=1280376 RepID=A0A7Z0D4V6_9MICO|nr:acyl-CoA desaturase [Spelaeicoccus albus]NYI68873.1 fatty acid desaturase [Spelaeicoccus albus]
MDQQATYSAPASGRTARGAGAAARYTNIYTELQTRIKDHDLLRRRYGFYWTMLIGSTLVLAAIGFLVVWLGDSWLQLIAAGALGALMAQFGFLGHEAAHQQMFKSRRWNEWIGRIVSGLFTGLSYGWWMNKHNLHHGFPNQEQKDPDIKSNVLAFTPAAAATRTGFRAEMAKRQGYLFFPLLLLEGVNLHFASIKTIAGKQKLKHRWSEATFVGVRLIGYVAMLFILLPPGMAAAFLGVQLGVFGFLLGAAFAPNHKGMPIVPTGMKVDFFRRQTLMSRNITGGRFVDFFMGGLNYQIEHHLFPSMPRPNLRATQKLVKAFCAEKNVTYTEKTLAQSYAIVVKYLNQVGLKERDPFACPLVQLYRA